MTDRQALLSAAGKQRPYKAVNIKPPAMPGDIYLLGADDLVPAGKTGTGSSDIMKNSLSFERMKT